MATLSTLMLEVLDSRLLSALTWYHLSFLAVSVAMLGMAAGAVFVFLGDAELQGTRSRVTLARYATILAVAIPCSHLVNLCIPIPMLRTFSIMEAIPVVVTTTVLAVPFIVSGVVVTLALTRSGGPIGKLYAADLLGASAGCLLFIPLLNTTNITSVALIAGAVAAGGSCCLQQFAGRRQRLPAVLALMLVGAAVANSSSNAVGVAYPKNRQLWLAQDSFDVSAWNTHSYITIQRPVPGPAFYWGPGTGGERFETTSAWIAIDGEAGTPITRWDGQLASLEWVKYDVTSLPYYLRRGSVAIIGVGGGRDILSALWGGNSSITAVEINEILVDALKSRYRTFAGIADRPEVRLVNDEGRAYLSRTQDHYDVLQMSLTDTWAATGAGAFTLSENGLYTREAWRLCLDRLKPHGVFSVSRWFAPSSLSETTRLLALATSALLERGITRPADHLIMLAKGGVATLLVSVAPFDQSDADKVNDLAARFNFGIYVAPWRPPQDAQLQWVVRSASPAGLVQATRHPLFDFSPPTDDRPYFFNMLKPAGLFEAKSLPSGGVMRGNLRATSTLLLLFVIAVVLTAGIVVVPLVRSGLPAMDGSTFTYSAAYFVTIGFGFMLIQIPFLQRFSVYLGHPTYTFAVTLFSMICFTGIGSFISDRTHLPRDRWLLWLPAVIAAVILVVAFALPAAVEATFRFSLPVRTAVVVAFIAPLSVLLGFCFPLGMKLVGTLSDHALAWMWGINGACGVVASIAAVAVSMWLGTRTNLFVAAALYLLLELPTHALARRAAAAPKAQPAGAVL